MRLAAPHPFSRKRREMRLGGDRQRERARERVERMIPADPGQVERFERTGRPLGRPWTAEEPLPVRCAEQGKHKIAPGIHVVHRYEQLTEAWLAEILGQQFNVSPGKVGWL